MMSVGEVANVSVYILTDFMLFFYSKINAILYEVLCGCVFISLSYMKTSVYT